MATWNFYLLKEGELMAYWTKVSDIERHKAACHCADKVSDGSDADAFIMVRSDQDVYDFIHTHFV
jgi:hypothetical protein